MNVNISMIFAILAIVLLILAAGLAETMSHRLGWFGMALFVLALLAGGPLLRG